jgi:tetratricopeptide (TPR) repeat protein
MKGNMRIAKQITIALLTVGMLMFMSRPIQAQGNDQTAGLESDIEARKEVSIQIKFRNNEPHDSKYSRIYCFAGPKCGDPQSVAVNLSDAVVKLSNTTFAFSGGCRIMRGFRGTEDCDFQVPLSKIIGLENQPERASRLHLQVAIKNKKGDKEEKNDYYFYNAGAIATGAQAPGGEGTSFICTGCDDSMDVLYVLLAKLHGGQGVRIEDAPEPPPVSTAPEPPHEPAMAPIIPPPSPSATVLPTKTNVVRDNEQIAEMNSFIVQSRDAMKSTPPDYEKAAALMSLAISIRPTEGLLWATLGDADFGEKKYNDAITAYKKAIEMNAVAKTPSTATEVHSKEMIDQSVLDGGNNTDAAPPPPELAMAPILPPPPPPATPKTIALDQTKDEVVAILGQPTKIANLGTKEIDYYSDMKVVYTNGKVTDIQ